MKTVITDIIIFLKKFWTILWVWIQTVIEKYKFKNALMLLIAFYLRYIMGGEFGRYWGVAVFFVWIGINIESLIVVFKDLKDRNDW